MRELQDIHGQLRAHLSHDDFRVGDRGREKIHTRINNVRIRMNWV
jgi:hypothetical protein